MKEAIIPTDLASAIHDYLTTRPMREVEGLVSALRQARPYEECNTASDRMEEKKWETNGK
ncbi:MAG TPA: hypothetical protein PKE50_15295 [Rhodocyclaceae bacterium]|nr:hypothetical protein [Rhodocyclaceae bacterium]